MKDYARLVKLKKLNDRYLEMGIVPTYWTGYSEVVRESKD